MAQLAADHLHRQRLYPPVLLLALAAATQQTAFRREGGEGFKDGECASTEPGGSCMLLLEWLRNAVEPPGSRPRERKDEDSPAFLPAVPHESGQP